MNQLRPSVSAQAAGLVAQMLAKEPRARPTMAQVEAALEAQGAPRARESARPQPSPLLPRGGTEVLPHCTEVLPHGTEVLPHGTEVLPHGTQVPLLRVSGSARRVTTLGSAAGQQARSLSPPPPGRSGVVLALSAALVVLGLTAGATYHLVQRSALDPPPPAVATSPARAVVSAPPPERAAALPPARVAAPLPVAAAEPSAPAAQPQAALTPPDAAPRQRAHGKSHRTAKVHAPKRKKIRRDEDIKLYD